MFEVPEAKRVRREDLNVSDDGENESDDGLQDAELRAKLHAQMARSLGLDFDMGLTSDAPIKESRSASRKETHDKDIMDVDADEAAEEDDHEEEFAFRLFSKAPATQKVVLEEDTGPTGTGVFVSGRPLSYYVVTNVPAQQKQEYAIASISGDQVLARSGDRAWGLELPWKVTKLTISRKANPDEKAEGEGEGEETRGKRRPGKKQRISLRKRAKAKEEKKAADAKKMADKEEHIKDKKKRMNRLKKLRKRAKAREQKQTTKGEDGQSDESDGDSGSE
ncbi:hypothetical protein NW752_004948 [Fusarium irregulare]|nr:hypothetical protein NW752_004948 [Fusarium irregulare]